MTLAELDRKIKTIVFNSDGKIPLDIATRQVLATIPTEGLYDLLFGDGRNGYDGLHKADRD